MSAATIQMPHVIGLDISLAATGIASSNGWTETVGMDGVTTLPLARRERALRQLSADILALVGWPDLAVLERPNTAKAYGGLAERCGLWWRVVHALAAREVPVADPRAFELKQYALGKRSGTKGAVVEAVARAYPGWPTGGDDNKADAVVLMAMGRDHLGCPLAAVPKARRAALAAVAWPEVRP